MNPRDIAGERKKKKKKKHQQTNKKPPPTTTTKNQQQTNKQSKNKETNKQTNKKQQQQQQQQKTNSKPPPSPPKNIEKISYHDGELSGCRKNRVKAVVVTWLFNSPAADPVTPDQVTHKTLCLGILIDYSRTAGPIA